MSGGNTIPAAWLDANRADVLRAIENGAKEAVIDYIHTMCTRGTFDAIESGVQAAVASDLAVHPVSSYEALVDGVKAAVAGYAESNTAFDDAAEGTARAVGDYARSDIGFDGAVAEGTARAVSGAK